MMPSLRIADQSARLTHLAGMENDHERSRSSCELTDAELDAVSGGLTPVGGRHFNEATFINGGGGSGATPASALAHPRIAAAMAAWNNLLRQNGF
jgi:hypothetical protein